MAEDGQHPGFKSHEAYKKYAQAELETHWKVRNCTYFAAIEYGN